MRLVIAALLCVSAKATAQGGLSNHAELMEEGARRYAEAAARLSLCGRGPGEKGLEEVAATWAEWARPGFINTITRRRGAFQEDVLGKMERWYSLESIAGECSRFTASLTEVLLDQIEYSISEIKELPYDG